MTLEHCADTGKVSYPDSGTARKAKAAMATGRRKQQKGLNAYQCEHWVDRGMGG